MSFLEPPGISRAEALTLAGGNITEDPTDPGTFITTSGGLAEDPADPGTYLIGA